MKSPWYQRHFVALLVGAAISAMIIALSIGLRQSVWFDESYSIMLAKEPLTHLLQLTAVDTHPPLYYLLLKLWMGLFGDSEAALRSLSVLAMGGSFVAAGLFMRRIFGVRAALLALPLVVLSPFLLRYGFEIRMYSLASLIGISATCVLVRAQQAEGKTARKWYFFYAVLVALGVYTLYYTALLWVAHALWLVYLAWRDKKSWRPLLAYLGSFALFLPWLPAFIGQLGNGALSPAAQQVTLENMTSIVSFWFLYTPTFQLNGLTSLVIFGVIASLVFVGVKAAQFATKEQRPYLVLLALYSLVPMLLIACVSLLRPMYMERYTSHVGLGALLLLGAALAIVWQKKFRLAALATAGLVLVSTIGVFVLSTMGNYNYQRLEQPAGKLVVTELANCNDQTIIFKGIYLYIEQWYYFRNCNDYVYETYNPDLRGGYAPLHDSPKLTTLVEAKGKEPVKFVHYQDDSDNVVVADGYELKDTTIMGKIVIDTYAHK